MRICRHTGVGRMWGCADSVSRHEETPQRWSLVDGYFLDGAESHAQTLHESFEKRGPASLDDHRGAYLGLVVRGERCLLVRDALGLWPVYYALSDEHLWVSSSPSALREAAGLACKVNATYLAECALGVAHSGQLEESFFAGISRVPPAHALDLRPQRTRLFRYWDPLPEGFSWTRDHGDRSLALLRVATERCLRAGAGSLALSGGYDSIALACTARRLHQKAPTVFPRLQATSLHFSEPSADESEIQRRVAEALDMPFELYPFGASADSDVIAKALSASKRCPGPVLSPWQWMYEPLMKAVAKQSGKLMLGTGGDELFTVDPVYAADLMRGARLPSLYPFLRAWQRSSSISAAKVARFVLWRSGLRRLGRDAVVSLGTPRWPRAWAAKWMSALGTDRALARAIEERSERGGESALDSTPYRDALRGIPQSPLFVAEFEQSFAWARSHGVTMYLPFLDRDLVEHTLRLWPRDLYRDGTMKAPLRRLCRRDLPVSLPRKKVDFSRQAERVMEAGIHPCLENLGGVPRLESAGIATTEGFSKVVEDTLHRRIPGNFWRLWRIMASEAWLQAHDLG